MTAPLTPHARRWLTANAVVAWLGLAFSLTLTLGRFYPEVAVLPGRYGNYPAGSAELWSRLSDWLSYFTILSNALVAVMVTALATGRATATARWQAVRLGSLVMICVTGLVYAVVLAPTTTQRGWENVSNTFVHQLTPAFTVLVWAVAGPRGWVSRRTLAGAFAVPLVWVVWMLARGAVIGAYPYGFISPLEQGWGRALANTAGVLVLGLLIGSAFLGADRWLTRRQRVRVDARE